MNHHTDRDSSRRAQAGIEQTPSSAPHASTGSDDSTGHRTQILTDADVIVVGAGLAGLVAAYEASREGLKVLIVDQESSRNRGGQAFWSLGGIFLVDSPEQRHLRIKDSEELALTDWLNTAQFDREKDYWPREWAKAYVHFAATEKRKYLHDLGVKFLPIVGWAERGGASASGHGNSVPRFHLTWGTGPEIVRAFLDPVEEKEREGAVTFRHMHRVDELIVEHGRVTGVRGRRVEPVSSHAPTNRGQYVEKKDCEEFEFRAPAVVMSTGGIGANDEHIRAQWPEERFGPVPRDMVTGVPAHVDGRGLSIAHAAGAELIGEDRMWHYTEGMTNWDPIWPNHGIRIIAGPSSMWFDAAGNRLPATLIPGADTITTMRHILQTGHAWSWFVLNSTIVAKEFMFSGSEQNPDITDKSLAKLAQKVRSAIPTPIQKFIDHGQDWVTANTVEELAEKMNSLINTTTDGEDAPTIDPDHLAQQIRDRDSQIDNPFSKDYQVNYIRTARRFLGDRLIRAARPHKIADPEHGPPIAVRLKILTRKTLGGFHTNLDGQALSENGEIIPGLWAAGEASGFGGGGVHGYNALEGTFLGGCIFSGLRAGRNIADVVGKKKI